LLDDRVARRFAESEALKVKGTLDIVADAAKAGLLNFRATVETLQQATMHLDAKLAQRLVMYPSCPEESLGKILSRGPGMTDTPPLNEAAELGAFNNRQGKVLRTCWPL
jgi:hypothetical protein